MVSAGIFMGEFYFTMLLLWVLLIGLAIVYVGSCIRRLTRALSEPALLAFTTSSSEAAFPGTLEKLEQFGVSPKIASFVLPIGYSFNLVDQWPTAPSPQFSSPRPAISIYPSVSKSPCC